MKPKSHTLFHFTKSRETLQLILKNGFWPRYCLEDVGWLGIPDADFVAYPMVCFCDIPLSRTDEHVAFYGDFGVGMSKEWAVKNDLNPILYMASQNTLAKSISEMGSTAASLPEKNKRQPALNLFRHLAGHIKPSEGTMVVAGKPVQKEFYQESEWRFIPRHSEIRDHLIRANFDNVEERERVNEKAKAHSMLKFVPNDVKYIFVSSDSDIPAIINFIQTELDMFPSADLKVLMSRVTSIESVSRDI